MAREYSIILENTTVTAARTLIFLNPGATRAIEILRLWAEQSGGATSAQVRLQIVKKSSLFPTLTSYTPQALKGGDAASAIVGGTAGAAGTCGINASAEGAGGQTTLFERAFNNLNGFEWLPGAFDSIILPPSGSTGIGIYMPAAPSPTTGWCAGMIFRELG